MCRHLTIIPGNNSTVKPENAPDYEKVLRAIVSIGLRASSTQGNDDGVGAAFFLHDKNKVAPRLVKSGSRPNEFIPTARWYKHLMGWRYDVRAPSPIIGHVRRASVQMNNRREGKYADDDSHPFKFTRNGISTILAHNGTIKNYEKVGTESGIEVKDKIDSYVLAKLMSQMDLAAPEIETPADLLKALNSVTSRLEGSFTVVLSQSNMPNKVIIGTHTRPLHFANIGPHALVFTDEEPIRQMMKLVEEMSRWMVPHLDVHLTDVQRFENDTWWVIDLMKDTKPRKIGEMEYHEEVVVQPNRVVWPQAATRAYTHVQASADEKDIYDRFQQLNHIAHTMQILRVDEEKFLKLYAAVYNINLDPLDHNHDRLLIDVGMASVMCSWILHLHRDRDEVTWEDSLSTLKMIAGIVGKEYDGQYFSDEKEAVG